MVPIARFENVCEELNNALKREQQAQALLHEQTAQMQEMGERLELHANQGEEKDVTLAEAVKVLCLFLINGLCFLLLHGLTPSYIRNLIAIKPSNGTRYNLRSTNELLLSTPVCRSYRTLGKRSFTMAAPGLWNSLQTNIKNARTVDSFKALLKTHLFKVAIPNWFTMFFFLYSYFCHFYSILLIFWL